MDLRIGRCFPASGMSEEEPAESDLAEVPDRVVQLGGRWPADHQVAAKSYPTLLHSGLRARVRASVAARGLCLRIHRCGQGSKRERS
jgi:hypothetical protein